MSEQERYPVRTEGPMYLHRMPTEILAAELEEAKAETNRLRAELIAQKQAACPDAQCENCRKVRAWDSWNGDVDWLVCPTCQAGVGEPCRHAGRGVGRSHGSRPPVLKRPHPGRPWAERPGQDLV